MQWYTTWIGEVRLGHWGRSGLRGDVAVEEGFGGVSGCETENLSSSSNFFYLTSKNCKPLMGKSSINHALLSVFIQYQPLKVNSR